MCRGLPAKKHWSNISLVFYKAVRSTNSFEYSVKIQSNAKVRKNNENICETIFISGFPHQTIPHVTVHNKNTFVMAQSDHFKRLVFNQME